METEKLSEIWLRIGVMADKRFFDKKDLYFGIVVPAHVLTAYPSLKSWIQELEKPYIIDPMTYILALDPSHLLNDSGSLRPSFSKLADAYKGFIQKIIGRHRITPIYLEEKNDDNSCRYNELVDSVLRFQIGERDPSRRERSLQRLRSQTKKEEPKPINIPHFLVAPYFKFDSVKDDWYECNLRLASLSKKSKVGEKFDVYPVLTMQASVLRDMNQLNELLEDYSEFAGVIIWVSGLDERIASLGELKGLKKLVKVFSNAGVNVYNLYGGYFSHLLSKFGISGVCSGICYGERKNVVSFASGGRMYTRYYIPQIAMKLVDNTALSFFKSSMDTSLLFNCRCSSCKEFVSQMMKLKNFNEKERRLEEFFKSSEIKPSILSWETSRTHFLECRHMEVTELSGKSVGDIVKNLEKNHAAFAKVFFEEATNRSLEYLRRWREVLTIAENDKES